MFTLGELADQLDLTFSGDRQRQITGLASLREAGPNDLSFLSSKKYVPYLATTQAAAVILEPAFAEQCVTNCLLSDSPYLALAHASQIFGRLAGPAAGIHASAVVSPRAQVDKGAAIGPHVVVEADAVVQAGAVLEAGVYLGEGSEVGAGSRIHPNVVIYSGVIIGDNCSVHSATVLGADGFGFARGAQGWEKIHQLGGLRIGDNVEIGAGTTIDRGALEDTVVGDGVIIDNQVHIAHNCRIGKNTAIAGCTGLAGGTIIGADCTLAGGVGVVGHLEICDNVHITGMSMVTRSITEPGSYSSGTPMAKTGDWKRSAVRFSQLESIAQRLAALERQT